MINFEYHGLAHRKCFGVLVTIMFMSKALATIAKMQETSWIIRIITEVITRTELSNARQGGFLCAWKNNSINHNRYASWQNKK